MNETVPIALQHIQGEIRNGSFEFSTRSPWSVRLKVAGLRVDEVSGASLFDCLRIIRERIEPEGWRVLCNGARVDAYPSRMSLEMGGGRKVYLLQLGTQADRLVDIFEPAQMSRIGTVKEQSAYYERWLESLE